ncbi:hypothetical protein BKA62DRAFT_624392 [Auriculariales sp. MPI-PUGE-AT-0066]|nr:hypothetical protein BKA62DRAFT_624392 [Auriculariales sp. MPI-PUGE-AT-0066]
MLDKPGLLQDYAKLAGFADQLEEVFGGGGKSGDPRLGYVLATLRAGKDRPLPNFLSRLPPPPPPPPPVGQPVQHQIVSNGKVKSKAKAKDADPGPDLSDPRIDQLADIFPDHDRLFLWKCIHHPIFDGEVDAVVSALLEGNAPPDLLVSAPASPSPPSPTALPERRNVFDDDDMDFSKLRLGKQDGTADKLLQTSTDDKAFAEQMKADILRRVQEMEIEDAEEEERDRFGEGYDVSVDGVIAVRDGADAEGEPEVDEATKKQREIEFILEEEYIKSVAVFARDSDTRRSKARVDLRERTGWADEQIEGWAIMLERNPQKDKILAKHQFAGNRRDEESDEDDDESSQEGEESNAGPSGSNAPRGRGRGRGGRGRGGGGGGRGGGGGGGGGQDKTQVDRRRKNARKGQDKRRGHDKKMGRMGGGPPAS